MGEIRFLDFLSFHDFSRNPVFAVLLAHVFGRGGGGEKKMVRYSDLATFEAAAMHGFVTTNRIADRDLGPGVVLGGGGGEDVVKEVGWRAWRRRTRWRKGCQNARSDFYQISGLSFFP
jgi:hypothetical protein